MTRTIDHAERHTTAEQQVEIPTNSTLVYLIRHGITRWNVERRFQGQLQVPLSTEGELQALAVAEWLAGQPVRFTAIYSSDLSRAAETARIIGEKLHLTPVLTEDLRELNCGEWQGLSVDEIEASQPGQLQHWHDNLETFTIPGGECVVDVQHRMLSFFKSVTDQHRGEAIIVVSHGAALSALFAALHQEELGEWWHSPARKLGNTSVTALLYDNDQATSNTHFFNSVRHLPDSPPLKTVLDKGDKPNAV